MKYQFIDLGYSKYVERTNDDGTISNIPCDLENIDYQAYLKSLENDSKTK